MEASDNTLETSLQTIPQELVQVILFWAVTPRNKRDANGMVTHIVCQFVCKLWRSLLSPFYATFPSSFYVGRAIKKHHEQRFLFMSIVALEGNLSLLKWGQANGCRLILCACSMAAEGGHLEVLKWLREKGCSWDFYVCFNAAKNGHLELLKWARENGAEWDDWTGYITTEAACRGHLEVLKYLRENGAEWNEWTCHDAARLGRLEVLNWAIENGCPWY